jgi:hypothetical protein
MKLSSKWISILLLACVFHPISVVKSRQVIVSGLKPAIGLPTTNECKSVAQGLLAPSGNVSNMPTGPGIFLNVEVPSGHTPISFETLAKVKAGGSAWINCPSTCGDVIPQAGLSLTNHGVSLGDSTYPSSASFSGLITPVWHGPPNGRYFEPTFVRLSVSYNSTDSSCLSQASWEVDANHSQPMALMVPAGRHLTHFSFYATEIPPQKVKWQACDYWHSPNTTDFDHCISGPPNLIGMVHNPPAVFIDDDGSVVGSAQAQGIQFICSNGNGQTRRGCRGQISYE